MARRYAAHLGQGTLRGLGPGYWYGGPWLGITLLHAVKDPSRTSQDPGRWGNQGNATHDTGRQGPVTHPREPSQ